MTNVLGEEKGMERGEGRGCVTGGTHSLLGSAVLTLIMHPSRIEPPLPLLVGAPPTFGCTLRYIHLLHKPLYIFYRRIVSSSTVTMYLLG